MDTDLQFQKLNRLRANAGKPELKSWKASQLKLTEAIGLLETAGFTDVLPGADINAAPVTTDPEVAANLKAEEKAAEKTAPKVTVEKIGLARGLDTDDFAKNCRQRVRDAREKEKKEIKRLKTEEKSTKKITGAVDPKVDPEKAKRQQEHVAAKQKARAEKPATTKNADQLTVADLAREVGMDPKVARAKLRRYENKPEYPKTVKGERWTFAKGKDADAIRKILTGAN